MKKEKGNPGSGAGGRIMRELDRFTIRIFCFFIFLFGLLWILVGFLIDSDFILPFLNNPVVIGFLLSTLFSSAFFFIYIIQRYLAFRSVLQQSDSLIKSVKDGSFQKANIKKSSNILSNLIHTPIMEMVEHQEQKFNELNEQRNTQLYEKNAELNDAYMQLESSYGQLQAAIEQLNDSEQRYHSLVRNIPDIVLTLDNMGNITYASRAVNDILGCRRHDLEGKPFQCILDPDSAGLFHFDNLKQAIDKNGEYLLELPLRKKDQTLLQTEIKFTPVQESPMKENIIQAIIHDVTEQKRIESILLETNHRLKILNDFSHKLASAMELSEIYQTCVNMVTDSMGFYGCVCFMTEKNDRFYRIAEHSGDYFNVPQNLEQFSYIHRNAKVFTNKENDAIVLDFNTALRFLVMNPSKGYNLTEYGEIYIQELRIGGEAAGLLLVLTKTGFLPEELEALRTIGHTMAVAVENTMHLIQSKNSYVQTIDALIAAIEAKDQYTRGHSQRVSSLAVKIAHKMKMSRQQVEDLRIAGILHDIGKIGISDRILFKKGTLTNEEYEEIKKHPAISNKILYPIGLTDRILKAIAFHHERFDGMGYPFGLTNESLGIEPQIIAVADAFDAMTSSRPYRSPLTIEEALLELERNKGSQFHPEIVDIMIQIQTEENKDILL